MWTALDSEVVRVRVCQALDKHRQRHRLAMLEISRLQTDIRHMQDSECHSSEAVVTLRDEVGVLSISPPHPLFHVCGSPTQKLASGQGNLGVGYIIWQLKSVLRRSVQKFCCV